MTITEQMRGRIVVSCQAEEASPFRNAEAMSLMARTVILGGACALRLESTEHVSQMCDLGVPVIGLVKRRHKGSGVYITPTASDVGALVKAGASVIALDATPRERPGGEHLEDLVRLAHDLGVLVMGDVDSVQSADYAEQAGVDWIGTTLSGYTGPRTGDEPDIALVGAISRRTSLPVIAEGRYSQPKQVSQAFANGAWSIVVGTAISDPLRTTRRFVAVNAHPGGPENDH